MNQISCSHVDFSLAAQLSNAQAGLCLFEPLVLHADPAQSSAAFARLLLSS